MTSTANVMPLRQTAALADATVGNGAATGSPAVLTAVAAWWPSLSVDDLGAVYRWAEAHADVDADRLIAHLGADAGIADPRVQLSIRLTVPVDDAGPAPLPRPTPGEVPVATAESTDQASTPAVGSSPMSLRSGGTVLQLAPAAEWVRAPHALIGSDLSDAAVQLWLVLGSVPATDQGFRSVAPAWIARRAGWSTAQDDSARVAERRIQRAAAELTAAGWLSVARESIGGGRSRPAYHRLRQPRRRGFERVEVEALQLRPALLRAWCRLLQVMGHRRETHLTTIELAQRWSLSDRQVRRHLHELADAGLVTVTSGAVTKTAIRPREAVDVPELECWATPSGDGNNDLLAGFQGALPLAIPGSTGDSGSPEGDRQARKSLRTESTTPYDANTPVDNPCDKNVHPRPPRTFLSHGTGHFCRPKEVHTGEVHTPLGTLVPNVEDLERESANDRGERDEPSELDLLKAPSAAEPPERRQSRRDDPLGLSADRTTGCWATAQHEASRVLHRFLWLRRAPDNVPHQVRVVIAGQIRRGLTAEEIITALVTRLNPGDVSGREVPAIREVLRGIWADRKASSGEIDSAGVFASAPDLSSLDAVAAAGPDGPGLAATGWLEAVLRPPAAQQPDWTARTASTTHIAWICRRVLWTVFDTAAPDSSTGMATDPVMAAPGVATDPAADLAQRLADRIHGEIEQLAIGQFADRPAALEALDRCEQFAQLAYGTTELNREQASR